MARRLLVLAGFVALASGGACAKRLAAQAPEARTIEAQTAAPGPAVEPSPLPRPSPAPAAPGAPAAGRQVGPRIATYYLSGGDEIRVSVLGSPDLSKTVRIPPDGHIYYPMVGDIAVDGMSIPEFRQILADRLRAADEQRIGTGDQISIRVYRNDDLSMTTLVPSSGRITLLLGGEVDLAGLTVEEANQAIAKALLPYVVRPSVSTTIVKAASGLPGRISDPQVTVEVLAFGGHKVLVLGEVERPGVYLSDGGSRLLEVVARAGGPTKDAKLKNVALIRPGTETSPPRAAVLDLDRAMKDGDVDQNPAVQRGDVVYVPRTTIASVARFFEQVYAIVRPFVAVESGIWLGQNIDAGPRGQTQSSIVFP